MYATGFPLFCFTGRPSRDNRAGSFLSHLKPWAVAPSLPPPPRSLAYLLCTSSRMGKFGSDETIPCSYERTRAPPLSFVRTPMCETIKYLIVDIRKYVCMCRRPLIATRCINKEGMQPTCHAPTYHFREGSIRRDRYAGKTALQVLIKRENGICAWKARKFCSPELPIRIHLRMYVWMRS